MTDTAETTLEFVYPSTEQARIISESVAREIGEIDDARSRTALSQQQATITLEIRARDFTALRAALNTWFSLIGVAEATATVGRGALSTPADE